MKKMALVGILPRESKLRLRLMQKMRSCCCRHLASPVADTSGHTKSTTASKQMHLSRKWKPGVIGKKSQQPLFDLPAIFGSNHTSPGRDLIGAILQ
jgi:hypothetical protein